MGSASSSQVKSIGDSANNATEDTITSVADNNNSQVIKTAKSTVAVGASCSKVTSSATVTTLKAVSSASHPSERSPAQSSEGSSHTGLELKLKQLEKELAESESEKLDLVDHIQALEERLQELTTLSAVSAVGGNAKDADSAANKYGELQETLKAKDHYIQQMERQLAAAQAESNKVRARLKKKVKTLTAQLSEARQESSIAHLEYKEHSANLQDQLLQSHADKQSMTAAAPDREDNDKESSKFKVILDLSAQVSDQAERISELQRELQERDREIEQLKHVTASALSQTIKSESTRTDLSERAQDGFRNKLKQGVGGAFSSQHSSNVQNSRNVTFSGSKGSSRSSFTPVESSAGYSSVQMQGQRPISKTGRRDVNGPVLRSELTLQRQSTALSDSDSDWEVMDTSSSKIHSAPARMRVKSAVAMAEKNPNNTDIDKWSVATDDNDLMLTAEEQLARGNNGRQNRKSALKTKLERERNERAKGLMGPSLAFGAPAGDQMTDTSCNNTPSATPRASRANFGLTSSDVMSFAV